MLKYTKENIFLQRVQLIREPKFKYKYIKALYIVFYLAELSEVLLDRAKNQVYYLCLQIPLKFFCVTIFIE